MKSHDYRGNNKQFAEESSVAASLRKNGLLSYFSNSFVVVCSLDEKINHQSIWPLIIRWEEKRILYQNNF
jgi:hypothetical protein